MKVKKLEATHQPDNWFDIVTNECKGYPIHLVNIDSDELVLDIGGNVGGFWNAWKHRFDNWHLVEPSVYNCEQIVTNGYNGSYSRNAVSDVSGKKVKLQKYWGDGDNDTLSGNFGITGFVSDNGHGWKGEYEEVITLSLEDVVKDREVGLLKIDCEGAEYDFLYGKDLSNIKYITGEFHNFLFRTDNGKDLLTWIETTHDEIYSDGNGVDSHFVKLYKRKDL